MTALGAVTVRSQVEVALDRFGGHVVELSTFTGLADQREHVALRFAGPSEVPLVRVHSECFTGDIFGSARCDCGPQLEESIARLAEHGGVLLYLRQEGRGIGLYNKIDAYVLQDRGTDTFEANRLLGRGEDERDYQVAAEILTTLGVRRIRLLTNNPDKVGQLRGFGVEIVEVIPTRVHLTPDNAAYLRAKAEAAHHALTIAPGV
ncbi:GTP cyclohydrolase II [Actinokineospora diospyrosa]|uniref:GTP cyclohydrolase-2 n=1 Tax=Actinokineospora diospyrosa TaxID=103728 RepID=A0ABT1IJ79_9PSEU|nr:GTP cyclohydrolase II [Actinokineospora diospyrosa]MCP2272708.1 GTP cyclohydrolase II [Actinokineospora diospyrosa]